MTGYENLISIKYDTWNWIDGGVTKVGIVSSALTLGKKLNLNYS